MRLNRWWNGPPVVAALVVLLGGAASGQVRAGAAKRVITPELGRRPVWLAGFGQNRAASGVHDDLWARCAALEAGGGRAVLCSVDLIGLFLEDVEQVREAVRAKLPAWSVIVAATHVHQGPDTMGLWGPAPGISGLDPDYNRRVVERIAEAALEAAQRVRPAQVRPARLRSAELDGFIHDNRPPVVLDSELVVLRLTGRDGKGIATLVNWANHPEALGSKNTLITADFACYLYEQLEKQLGGVAVLFNGALGGMQSPLGAVVKDPLTGTPAPDGSFRKAELIGRRVAELAAKAVEAAREVRVDRLRYLERRVAIPVSNAGFRQAMAAGVFKGRRPLGADGAMETLVGVLRLEDRNQAIVEAALVPGELYPELSCGGIERYAGADFPDAPLEKPIKPLMRAPYRMLIGLANDEIGYIIPKAEWDEQPPWLQQAPRRWYGEVNSVGPEAAPRIIQALEQLLGDSRGR